VSTEIWRPPLTATFSHEGVEVELLPLGPQHRQVLTDAFGRLSERSRYLRFMAPISHLSSSDLDYLTDLDMVERFAWALLVEGEPAGVGRYARTTTAPSSVEVGITVLDEYQGRGLGRLLIQALAVVARNGGFATFEFEVLAENRPMISVLERLGVALDPEGPVVHGRLPIGDIPRPPVDPDQLLEVVGSARRA
jgi:GNAT superfamily N-acetyltransferase